MSFLWGSVPAGTSRPGADPEQARRPTPLGALRGTPTWRNPQPGIANTAAPLRSWEWCRRSHVPGEATEPPTGKGAAAPGRWDGGALSPRRLWKGRTMVWAWSSGLQGTDSLGQGDQVRWISGKQMSPGKETVTHRLRYLQGSLCTKWHCRSFTFTNCCPTFVFKHSTSPSRHGSKSQKCVGLHSPWQKWRVFLAVASGADSRHVTVLPAAFQSVGCQPPSACGSGLFISACPAFASQGCRPRFPRLPPRRGAQQL